MEAKDGFGNDNDVAESAAQSELAAVNSLNSSSRQYQHDEPPPLPRTTSNRSSMTGSSGSSATSSKASSSHKQQQDGHVSAEEEKTSSSSNLVVAEDQRPSIRIATSATVVAVDHHSGGSSSVRFSLATDSNYSSCSSSKSGLRKRTSGSASASGSRSMDLRKVPMDTSLLVSSSNSSSKNKNNNAKKEESAAGVLDSSDSTLDADDELGIPEKRRSSAAAKQDDDNKKCSFKLGSCAIRFLRSTCLRPNFSLQTQLLLSFGMVSTLTILLVMCICVAVSIVSGKEVNNLTRESLEELAYNMEGKIVRYAAEALSMRLLPDDVVQIMHDAAVDRFVGYPDYPGYENDTLTPFRDVYTQQRIYPVKGPSAQLDWDLQDVVTPENAKEHVQGRYRLYQAYENVTTSAAAYSFQGNCNPRATMGDYDWYPNCSDANNNITTGGVVHPVKTNRHLHKRSSDLTPLLKAIYEDTPTLRDLGICFANGGAGASLIFPGYTLDSGQKYISDGCDWMRKPNPYRKSQTIGTPEMIAKCHPKGVTVHNREYNPLERPWCREQALNPDSIQLIGPFADAWNNEVQLMLVGKAIYDPLTKEFIGCLFMDFTITEVQRALEQITVTPNSHVSITRYDPSGIVTASSARDRNDGQSHDGSTIQDLNIGVSRTIYNGLYSMVDYSSPWDPEQVRDTYANHIHHDTKEGYLVGAYPMPPVPSEYDPNYRPQWLVILSISTKDVLEPAEQLEDHVDDKVENLVYFTLVAGVVGWGVVMVVILVVSQALTLPLKSMNQATKAIVDNFGGTSEKGITYHAPSNPVLTRCAPETEISQVTSEFTRMIQRFSGKNKMAKAVQERFTELANHFSFEHEFEDLYKSRQEGSFAYNYEKNVATPVTLKSGKGRLCFTHKKGGSNLKNFGSIVTGSQSYLTLKSKKSHRRIEEHPIDPKGKRLTSPLFLWIGAFIVTPLLITTVTMSAIVTVNVSEELSEIIDDGKAEYVKLEKFTLKSAVALRANWIEGKTEKTTRDLHIVSRYAGWLLFGGLDRRDSFTELTSGTDQCKSESDPMTCPYIENYPCLEENGRNEFAFRYLQETYFVCESHDTLPDGDRSSSLGFPDVSFSPETTAWWDNITSVPGFEKGSRAEGYDTTYDRLRVLSAIPIFQTLYNANGITNNDRALFQSAVAMEADGMVVGYHGCSMAGEAIAAFWESTPKNHANDIRPELCPVGKFGFDPRCREWYDTGRKLSKKKEAQLYVAAPYWFATDSMIGQTVTSPLIDPKTGDHVGQAFVDYRSDPIYNILSPNNTALAGGYPILIAARADPNGANTIVGPGFHLGVDNPAPIEEVVLRRQSTCLEAECDQNRDAFRKVLQRMTSGRIGDSTYTVRKEDGTDEVMFIAYAPVKVLTFPALNSSEFSRGVSVAENTIFYLALTETEATLVAAFDQVEEDISQTIDFGIAVLSIAIVLATGVVVYISYWVAISITQPMLYLLELIRQINELDDDEILVDLDLKAGSREVKSVANTMGTLHKIVQCANSAYFAGDIEKAYAVLTDSARLFKRLDNKKAMGVANNNLGITMLAMYRIMKSAGAEHYCALTREEVVLKGLSYFHQSIQLGEKAYDEFYETEGWSPSCLDFMQHLANRYFNRAMFLLSVKDDHQNPKEIADLGMRDLQIARDMDLEIVDQGTEVGWRINTVDKLYKVALNRVRGHLLLLEMGYPDEWDTEELLEELFRSLKSEMKLYSRTSDLFRELGPAGRMQQVETELMRYRMLKGDVDTASKIAIRMLMEDEFILPDAQLKAVEILTTLVSESDRQAHLLGQLRNYESWLRRAKVGCDNNMASSETTLMDDVSEVISMSVAKLNLNMSMMDDPSEDFNISRKSSLLATTRGDVTMEIF